MRLDKRRGKSNAILHAAGGRSPPAAGGCGPRSRQAAQRLPSLLARALPGRAAAVLRHRRLAHAACIAAPHAACRGELSRRAAAAKTTAAVRPVLPLQPKAASAGCARGHCLSSPQPSRVPQRYAPSSPPARTRASVRCGRRIIEVPSFASPREVHPTVRSQRSSRRTGQRGLRPGCPRLGLGCQQLLLPRGAGQLGGRSQHLRFATALPLRPST